MSLLADMHLRHLREKMILKQRIEEVSRKVEVCVAVFHVYRNSAAHCARAKRLLSELAYTCSLAIFNHIGILYCSALWDAVIN